MGAARVPESASARSARRPGFGSPVDATLCPEDLGYCIGLGDHEEECHTCTCAILVDPGESHREDLSGSDDYLPDEYSNDATVTGAALNGVDLDLTSSTDPANAAHEDVWFTVPPELADYWSTSFPFDDPALSWVYAHVGDNVGSTCHSVFTSNYLNYSVQGAYLVCGLKPYVAYKVLSRSHTALYRAYRVRIWVGLMHHFSFFMPPAEYWDHSARWGTSTFLNYVDEAGADMWDEPSGKVDAKGRFVDMFTSLTDRVSFSIAWTRPDGTQTRRSNVFSCDPSENYDAASKYLQNTYQDVDGGGDPLGTAAPNAYSDPKAESETSDTMTAFLGTAAEADVCIFVAPGSGVPSAAQLGKRAFEILFDENVTVTFELKGQGFNGSSPAFAVDRWFVLEAADLQPVDDLVDELDALRATPEGRYVIRDYDLDRLRASAAAGKGLAGCVCV